MCCRYYVELSPELRPIIETARRSRLASKMVRYLGKKFKTEGEVFPTDMVPVIAPDKEGRGQPYSMVWGFTVPGIKGPVVNARSETAHSRSSFRESWERRRCVVPASYYFEWDHHMEDGRNRTGDKYAIQPAGQEVTWLAGLYRIEEGFMGFRYPVFTVLTREPSAQIKRIHDRMPVILPKDAISEWLDPRTGSARVRKILLSSQTDMIVEKVVSR